MDNNQKIKLSLNVSIVAGTFCVIVALLLLLNFWQISSNKPLESKAIEVLVERLHEDPNNDALKEEIRNLDLLARKAYFNSQWQVKTGAFILLFGAIVFAVALRVYTVAKSKIEIPEQQIANDYMSRLVSQKWLIGAGAGIFILALAASFSTTDYLKLYSDNSTIGAQNVSASEEKIEVVEVKKQAIEQVETTTSENNESSQGTDNPNENLVATEKVKPAPEVASTGMPKTVAKSIASPSDEEILANHPSFRGAFGNGISTAINVPVSFDGASGTNQIWKTNIPKKGYNSPVIWGNKIFLSGADEAMQEVYCFDKTTGKLIWKGKADNIPGAPAKAPKVTEDTGLAAPSVCTEGKHVVAIFATGSIICFDMDGKRLWAKNLGVPDNHYGHSSSLITYAGKVFVQYDTNRGSKVLALNIESGENLWETKRTSKISWASPILAEVNGAKQLVLTADPNVAGYNIDNGEELWSVDCMMGEVGPSVAFGEGLIFASNEYATLAAIDPKTGEIKWENDEYLPEVASPVVSNGLLFIATSYGVLVCYDAKTGDKVWEEEYNAGFYASPVIAENKLYALDTDGIMHILEASRELKVIGTPNLGEEGYTTPAFDNGKIFIRGNDSLYCFGK